MPSLKRDNEAYGLTSGANSPCVFVRLHRLDWEQMHAGSYEEDDLRWWAARIGDWRGPDVLVYFNEDGYGHAVRNALRLKKSEGSLRAVFGVEIRPIF